MFSKTRWDKAYILESIHMQDNVNGHPEQVLFKSLCWISDYDECKSNDYMYKNNQTFIVEKGYYR